MTKYEMLESRLNSIQAEMRRLAKNGGGDIHYAESGYFNNKCNFLKNHSCDGKVNGKIKRKNYGTQWDAFVRIAKSLWGKHDVRQLTYEQADVCVEFLNECVDILNKYEEIVEKIEKQHKEENA